MTYRSETEVEARERHEKKCELCGEKNYRALLNEWSKMIEVIRRDMAGCDERNVTDFVIAHVMSTFMCDFVALSESHRQLVRSIARIESVLTDAQMMNLKALERALDSTQH